MRERQARRSAAHAPIAQRLVGDEARVQSAANDALNGPLPMAEPRPEKKRQEAPGQPAGQRVLPMQLQIGDRLVDEIGTWEVASRPYTTNAGEDAHIRIKKVGQPDVTEIRIWGAHERVSVKRTTAEEDKR